MCTVILHMFHFSLSPNWNVSGILWLHCYNGTLCVTRRIRNCPFSFRKYRQTWRVNWHREVYRVFQAESGFFIKIIDWLILSKAWHIFRFSRTTSLEFWRHIFNENRGSKKFSSLKPVVLRSSLLLAKTPLESKVCATLYMILFLKNRRVFHGPPPPLRHKSPLVQIRFWLTNN